MSRLEAEQIFQAGKSLLEAGETEEAAQRLRKASTLYPEAAEYALWAAWAAFLCPGDTKKTAQRRQVLAKAALAALEANAQLALGHYALGLVLVAEGDPARAARFLARAVALDPTNGDAKTKLARLLEPRRK
jgi:Flp pilus assembly protein TadD